jgi:hypothetical protein
MKRLVAIGFVWAMCAVAWLVLGQTIDFRTGNTSSALLEEVHALWGPPLSISAPEMSWTRERKTQEVVTRVTAQGAPYTEKVERVIQEKVPVALVATAAEGRLLLEQRRKGLLWFPTYALAFQGTYTYAYSEERARQVTVVFPIPDGNAGLDGFEVRDSDGNPVPFEIRHEGAVWMTHMVPAQTRSFRIAFRTRGTSTWRYALSGTGTGQVRDFHLEVTTNFGNVDFPPGTLSPTRHAREPSGWRGEWEFESLISAAPIGIELPQRLNPGVVASRITYFAPVGLLFFFFVVSVLALARGKSLHPLNYFFLGCAFFAFHLLFAYLVDHLSIAQSFAIASLTATVLVVTYARWFVGWKFSLREMGGAQLLYLVLFSFTFFWDGYTGLSITVGAVLTLFAMMQVTGRLDWKEILQHKGPPPAPPSPSSSASTPIPRELPGVVDVFATPAQRKPEPRGEA